MFIIYHLFPHFVFRVWGSGLGVWGVGCHGGRESLHLFFEIVPCFAFIFIIHLSSIIYFNFSRFAFHFSRLGPGLRIWSKVCHGGRKCLQLPFEVVSCLVFGV